LIKIKRTRQKQFYFLPKPVQNKQNGTTSPTVVRFYFAQNGDEKQHFHPVQDYFVVLKNTATVIQGND
jgi:quercetin dioxygenase-like cupin family protein